MLLARRYASAAAAAAAPRVLLLGSGLVCPPVVDILAGAAEEGGLGLGVTVASPDAQGAARLAARQRGATTAQLDIMDAKALARAVGEHDLVISLAPAPLHPRVATACIAQRTDLVTTSYISPEMAALDAEAKAAGITVLNEIGLDPGMDHLAAMSVIHRVQREGGEIEAFVSFCGGLPAPEAASVPLQYKFSWSPRGVLVAGLNQATYRKGGEVVQTEPGKLFSAADPRSFFRALNLEGYPNRDSTAYAEVYGIESADTILRGTLRYGGFCEVMLVLQELGLFADAEDPALSPGADTISWRQFVARLAGALDPAEADAAVAVRAAAAGVPASRAAAVLGEIRDLGLLGDGAVPQEGTAIDATCALLVERLAYGAGERDMVVMANQFQAKWPDGSRSAIEAKLIRMGLATADYSAMAECVGTPCALAAELLLSGKAPGRGVIRPTDPDIYTPLLDGLERRGIAFEFSESAF